MLNIIQFKVVKLHKFTLVEYKRMNCRFLKCFIIEISKNLFLSELKDEKLCLIKVLQDLIYPNLIYNLPCLRKLPNFNKKLKELKLL